MVVIELLRPSDVEVGAAEKYVAVSPLSSSPASSP